MSKIDYINLRMDAKKAHADFILRCERLKEEFLSTRLIVKPLWWTDLNKIKLEKDKEHLVPEGMVLINDIPINRLIANLFGRNKNILEQQELFHINLNYMKTCKILEHWKNQECLIPPRVVWSSYANSIEVSDGRHRLNTAICLGEIKIPVLISNTELTTILNYLI